ncbi:DUF72 domain-containing protein [Baia soyae]|uniref:Uncharacterized protein YecE (DUF72 family) n=1 Tax=Baia soyae TaxID=1544746 RepID=A0A4R2RXT3_9BACL|nr:DUF72 domain-containing protein [Baia soyae]TCP68308.1 uncharacterized protein YecE (DUF72 family) [Baia soyae]
MNQVRIGVCGWGDHVLTTQASKTKDKLVEYTSHFPIVELDSTFHAIAAVDRVEKWVEQTPETFRFLVKPYRELTGHGRPSHFPERSWEEIVKAVKESFEPMRLTGKCELMLFQFPPWYDCSQKHVRYIRKVKEAFSEYRLAIEFRNQSWFSESMCDQTLRFLTDEKLVHVVCDEPQAGIHSIPIVAASTHPTYSVVRFHGRNKAGWDQPGNPNWRDIRYAYDYSDEEISEWAPRIQSLATSSREVYVLFNNNSQGHAVKSARKMMKQLGISYEGLAPRQLSLLDWME